MEKAAIITKIGNAYQKIRQGMQEHYVLGEDANKEILKAADFCVTHQLDPVVYVYAQYRFSPTGKFFPRELAISANKAVANYNAYIETRIIDIAASIATQKSYLMEAVVLTGRDPLDILMEDFLNFQPWFRILISHKPVPKIIDKYKAAAKKSLTISMETRLSQLGYDISRINGK